MNLLFSYFIYLGVPIVNKKITISVWRPLIQKLKNKIQTWSNTWLNIVGKVVLIKSIISSYPIFCCTIFLSTKSVINTFNMEIMKFLWQGGKTQGRKFNLFKWDTVLEEKSNRGLGIRDLGKMNNSFRQKMVSRMISGGKEWWKDALRKKYIKRKNSKFLDSP